MRITDSILESFAMADAVIDFTTPKATVEHAKYAAQARLAHVIGTTGFNKNQLLKIKYALGAAKGKSNFFNKLLATGCFGNLTAKAPFLLVTILDIFVF